MNVSLRWKVRPGLTFRSVLWRQSEWKEQDGAKHAETHLKQWAGERQAGDEKWASGQTGDVGSTQSFPSCLKKLCGHTLQHADGPQRAVIGVWEPSICEKTDVQVDRSKCHQPKARAPRSLAGATQTGEVTTSRPVQSPRVVVWNSLPVASSFNQDTYLCWCRCGLRRFTNPGKGN